MNKNNHCDCHTERQLHVHEVQGSVEIAEREEDPHNHSFATVSSEAISSCTSHFHEPIFISFLLTFDGS